MSKVVSLSKAKKVTMISSHLAIDELKRSIKQHNIKKSKYYNELVIGRFIVWYVHNTTQYEHDHHKLQISSRDSNDDMFLSLALLSQANYLISVDKDLLILKSVGKTKIVTPKEFIENLKK